MGMVKKVTVSFVDDLDGRTAADETVAFTLDGVTYEIDLATKNAKKLRAALQPWIRAGRRVGGRRRSSIVGARRTDTQLRESAAIRVWARKHGYEVASRGRIPTDIMDAFRAAG
jgi:nucleoid-associated protein Lsr2